MKDLQSFLGEAVSARRMAELDAKGKGKQAREKAAADGQDVTASKQKALPTSALAIRKKEEEKGGELATKDDKGSDLVAKKKEEKKKRKTISNYMDTREKEEKKEDEKEEKEEKKKVEKIERIVKRRRKRKNRIRGMSSPFEKPGSVGTSPELGNISGGSRTIDRTKQS